MFRSRRPPLLVFLVAVLLLAGACGDDDGPGAAGGSPDATSDTPAGNDETADESDDTTTTTEAQETTTTTTTEAPRAEGAECVVGTWVTDNEAWAASFGAMMPSDAPMEVESVTGLAQVEFLPDGTAVTTYEGWTIAARVTEPAGEMTITREGVDHGTYTAGADGSLSMVDTEVTSVVTAQMSMGGQTITMPDTEGVEASVVGGAGTYECDGDRMSVAVDGATLWLDRTG